MPLERLQALQSVLSRVHGARVGSPIKTQADHDAVQRNAEALQKLQGGAMFDAFKAQVLLALILRQPNKQLELSVAEIDRTGGWSARMAVDQIARTFTFIASKHQ